MGDKTLQKPEGEIERDNLALHHAAMKGHAEIISMLVKAGSEVNAQDKNSWTPLINAAYWCQPDAVKALIENGCNPHLTNDASRTALHELCRSNSAEELKLAEIAQMLIEANVKLDAKCSDLGEADFTPIMFCAYHNHPKVAEKLIKAGCDINAQGSNGWTALHWASDRNHLEMIKVLLANGIDATRKGTREDTALDRSLDNKTRRILAEAMGVTYTPLEGMVLKQRRDALEAERKARYTFDIPPLPEFPSSGAENGGGVAGMVGRGPHSPGIVMPGPAEKSAVLQAMQDQMKQAQAQMKKRRLQRQRSMPTSLFRPPSPPKVAPEPPKHAATTDTTKPLSIFDTDAIGFIDSDEEAGSPRSPKSPKSAAIPPPPQNGDVIAEEFSKQTISEESPATATEIPHITKEPTPEKTTQFETTTVLDNGLVVPMVMESRGYVTTDEGESDSESEESSAQSSPAKTPSSGAAPTAIAQTT